jgi:hypothetical protein
MGRTGSQKNLNQLGDVAVPDIVGLQHNSNRETIKTHSITHLLHLDAATDKKEGFCGEIM